VELVAGSVSMAVSLATHLIRRTWRIARTCRGPFRQGRDRAS
jgi:hypothetical protein